MTIKWTRDVIAQVECHQAKALQMATDSPENKYNLTLDEVYLVCASRSPARVNSKLGCFDGARHEQYWEEMRNTSLDVLTQEFIDQINNEALLKYVLED